MTAPPLRAYQTRLARFIAQNPRCNLLAPMGSGKCLTTLTALEWLDTVEDVYPALILAPKRVAVSTWPDEVAKWPHLRRLRVAVVVGARAERKAALASAADLYCVNYDNIVWLTEELGDKWPFKTVIADESTRLKSFRLRQGGKRAQALSKRAFRSRRWVNLSGTFAPNGIKDVWAQTYFVDRGHRLGQSFSAFTQRWFYTGRDGFTQLPFEHSQQEIEQRISDISVSLNVRDFMELPPLIENRIDVVLPPDVQKTYRKLERELFVQLKSGAKISAPMRLTLTNKCIQLTAGALYVDDDGKAWEALHDAKLEALESVVEEAAGAPILVAYHFKFELERLKQRFGKRLKHLDANPTTVKEWNAGRIPILAAHPASAGHGLSLQYGGNIIVFMTSWWNLEEHQQIVERIGPTRQAQAGLNRPVFVHRIVARNTLDEEVLERLQGKADVQDALMRAMERRDARQ